MALASYLALLFILLLTILTGQLQGFWPRDTCWGAHQEYLPCGSACPLSCADVRQARYHKPCTYQCVRGCFCKRGYARRHHPRSQCIPDWRC